MKSLKVHRINFFEPDPKSIRCLAYDNGISRLAVSRSDASVEIWDVVKNPYLEKVIPSVPNTSVETLSWCNGRLFAAGLYGYIYEYDLCTLTLKYQLIVTSGCPVWCIAVNKQKNCLATGNEDGHVILHDLSLDGLDFRKKFDKQEGCILCLAWHKDGHVIVTGSKDTIRLWNVESGHVINRIILGRTAKNTPTIVWCISIMSDMTVVSGDSCGKTSFWDGNTGTLQSQVAVHKEDILTLCVSEEEDVIYASGVDPVIQMFMKSQSNGKWLKSVQRIVHTHDVRALQLVKDFLVSGGDDCNLVFTKYPPKTTIKYFPFCQMPYSVVAPLASCVLLRYPSYLEVWRIGTSYSGNSSPKKLLQVKTKMNEVIMCSSISADGEWLAYSSQFQMRLFSVHMEENSSDPPSISKVSLPDEIPSTASILLFTPKPAKLIFYCKGQIFILRCDKDVPKIEGTIEEDDETSGRTYLMELSSNGMYLACGSHNGSVIIYSLNTMKAMFRLPMYVHQPTAMRFDSSSKNLIIAYSDRKIVEYNLKKEAYSKWSKKQILLQLQEASFHPFTSIVCNPDKLYFQDENCIYIIKLEESQPDRKRLKNAEDSSVSCGEDTYISVSKYEHISSIHDFQSDLVVVEMSSSRIQDALPPPIWKKKYGT